MPSQAGAKSPPLRVFFHGGSALDETIKQAKPKRRRWVFRELVEEGLRLRRANLQLLIERSGSNDPHGDTWDRPISFTMERDGEGEMFAHMREFSCDTVQNVKELKESLRSLAMDGLLYRLNGLRRDVHPAALGVAPISGLPLRDPPAPEPRAPRSPTSRREDRQPDWGRSISVSEGGGDLGDDNLGLAVAIA